MENLSANAITFDELNEEEKALIRRSRAVKCGEKFAVRDGDDLAALFSDLRKKEQEHFYCVTLNAAHEVIKRHRITIGLVNQAPVHPREAFRHAVKDNAVAVAFAHNHPGGSAEPSEQDVRATLRLVEAGELLGIHVLDHLVMSRNGWRSALH